MRTSALCLVFPAYAGMSRALVHTWMMPESFPRLRGDEPALVRPMLVGPLFSPPTRG